MSEKVKLLMLLDGEFLNDIRVKKEALSLINLFDITVLTPNLEKRPETENFNGIEILRIKNFTKKSYKFIYDTWVAVFRTHPLFYDSAAKFIENNEQVVIHIHDLPLVGTGIKLKKKYSNVKFLVTDFHENYPEGLKGWNNRRKNIIVRLRNTLFFGQNRWTKYEKFAILNSDKIIAVIEEMKAYLVKKHQVSPEKIFLVPNSTSSDFGKDLRKLKLAKSKEKEFTILYIGGIGDHRGLDTLIKGLSIANKSIPQIKFVIYGKGNRDIINYLRSLIEKLDLEDTVEFNDWISIKKIPELIKQAHINTIPHKSNLHTDHTMPNKIYQMLLIGQPILVSSCKPIKRIVEETNSGKVFIAGDAESCAAEIENIYKEYELLLKNKDKIIELAERSYSWEKSRKN